MKTCRCCLMSKPESDFSKKACSPDGLQSKCKSCYSNWYRDHYEKTSAVKKEKVKRRYETKADEIKAYTRDWRKKNLAHSRDYAKKVAEKKNKQTRERRLANPQKYRELDSQKRDANPAYFQAKVAKRRAIRIQRTVAWCDERVVRFIYATGRYMTKVTGQSWHVDHVVPLNGKNVSGLHVHFNLMVVPASVNLRKSNKFEVMV